MSLGLPTGPSFTGPGLPTAQPTPPLSDWQLQQLPPPVLIPTTVFVPPPPTHAPAPPQRPALEPRPGVIGVACNLAVTASLLWICALSLVWVMATAGADRLAQEGETGPLFHILSRLDARLVSGLALPLYLFPAVSFVTGLLLLSQRRWARWIHTVVGLAALGWSAWWLRDRLEWWVSPAVYVAVACLFLWTPGASRWYARRSA